MYVVKLPRHFSIELPDYLNPLVEDVDALEPDQRMALAVSLSKVNIEHGGGPFGACIFERESGKLISIGVNLVVPATCSVAHAEMVAIILAQQAVGSFSLAAEGDFELVTSAEPCAQCFGAIPWSGVKSLVYGAPKADVEAIGFDEGPKPRAWKEKLEERGITVKGPVRRNSASAVLRAYAKMGHAIYNG